MPVLGLGFGALAGLGAAVIIGASADRLAYLAVAVLVLVMDWNGIRFAGGALPDAFMVVAFAAVAAVVVAEKRPVPLPSWMLIAGTGLVVAALLTIVFPPNAQLSRSEGILFAEESPVPAIFPTRSDASALVKFEIAWLVLPLMIAVVATTRRRCTRLLDLFVVSAVVSAAVAVVNLTAGGLPPPGALPDQRALGLTLHSNYLAFNSVVALPAALLWFTRGPRWSAMGLIAVSALLGGVYASGSRAGAIATVVALLATVLAVRQLRLGLRIVLPIAGMLLILVVLFTKIGQHVLQQVRLNSGNSTALASNQQRSLILDIAFNQIRTRPLEGVGFAVIQDAQNLYLQLLAAGGMIAFVSFAVYIGGLMRAAGPAVKGDLRPEATVAIVSILVWLFHGFFDSPLIDKYLYVMPGVLLAMSYVALRAGSDVAPDVRARQVAMPPMRPQAARDRTPDSMPLPAAH